MSLNWKLGDPNQNSYVNATYADEYFLNKPDVTEWDNLTSKTDKEAVLIQAARDMEFNYIDDVYYDSQGLAFPRDSHEVVTGNCATPITKNSFRHSSLKSDTYGVYPDNYWKFGTVHITSGTPLNDIQIIRASDSVTGSITTDEFSATPTINTNFIIFAPIDRLIRDAQCEQALFILKNKGIDNLMGYKTLGVQQYSIGDVRVTFKQMGSLTKYPFSPKAKKMLGRWMTRRRVVLRA